MRKNLFFIVQGFENLEVWFLMDLVYKASS